MGVKELFLLAPNANRLVLNTDDTEFEFIDEDAQSTALREWHIIKSLYENSTGTISIGKMFEKIVSNYISKNCLIRAYCTYKWFFENATQE